MCKEDWVRAYEAGRAEGKSERVAIAEADDRAAGYQASRIDAAMARWDEVEAMQGCEIGQTRAKR